MNLFASSALAPVAAGAPISLAAYLLRNQIEDAGNIFVVVVVGLPLAILLCVLGAFFLQSNELFQARHSILYCGLFGAGFAAIATLGIAGVGPLFWAIVLWGFLSGVLFRVMLGRRAT